MTSVFETAMQSMVADPNLAGDVVVTPVAGEARTVRGALVTRVIDFGEVVQREPVLHLATADAAGLGDGASVVAGGVTYRVRTVEPDGGGGTRLRLEAA